MQRTRKGDLIEGFHLRGVRLVRPTGYWKLSHTQTYMEAVTLNFSVQYYIGTTLCSGKQVLDEDLANPHLRSQAPQADQDLRSDNTGTEAAAQAPQGAGHAGTQVSLAESGDLPVEEVEMEHKDGKDEEQKDKKHKEKKHKDGKEEKQKDKKHKEKKHKDGKDKDKKHKDKKQKDGEEEKQKDKDKKQKDGENDKDTLHKSQPEKGEELAPAPPSGAAGSGSSGSKPTAFLEGDLAAPLIQQEASQPTVFEKSGKMDTRASFFEASLIVPGVSLKKFQLSYHTEPSRGKTFAAILGVEGRHDVQEQSTQACCHDCW